LKEEDMETKCKDVDKIKPLDRLFDEKMDEFESGEERACDKDLDTLIWELGDFESEESPQEAKEFEEESPIEEELVEKRMVVGRNHRASFREEGRAGEAVSAGVGLTSARSLSPEAKRKKRTPSAARHPRPLRGARP
jgi:hypothetical protein